MKNSGEHKLERKLGALAVFSIAAGAMISSGLFVLPGLAFVKAGPAVILSYGLAALLVVPSMLSQAELSTAMPKSGGTYFFIERSLGPLAGTLAGFANWFSLSFKSAFALAGLGAFGALLVPGITEFQMDMVAVAFCITFTVVNIISVKHAGRFQVVLVLALLAILVSFCFAGVRAIDVDHFRGFMPAGGMRAVLATMGLIFVSFGGLTKVASLGEETKNPGRNIPLGMAAAYFIVSAVYVVTVFVTVGVLPAERLSGCLTPISFSAEIFMGKTGLFLLAGAGVMAFITTANAGIMAASRAPMAMSVDRLLPRVLKRLHPRRKTPTVAILMTSVFMIAVILFLDLEHLVKTASTMMILLFMSVNLSVIIMRESKIHSYRPMFRSPLYPWIQVASLIVYGFLIFEMGVVPLAITGIFIAGGTLWYFLYVRRHVRRRSAMMHVVKRITAQEMQDATLERELKDILIERDQIIEDRFDRLIKECPIVDFEGKVSTEEACRRISVVLSPILGMEEDRIFDLFRKREDQSSTVIRPGLAIPHILIEGEGMFHVVLARSKEGIVFPGADRPVHAMFVLIGTMDERNYHLRALMAIAQIASEADFDERWLAAAEEELRNIILLAHRTRGTD